MSKDNLNRNYRNTLFPIFLIAMGLISLSGVSIFGSAALEGAAWKQNIMYALLIIFGMLPPFLREMKATWMVVGYALAFFMFGGANIVGTVGIMLGLEKIAFAVLMLFLAYRLWDQTWKRKKLYMAIPVLGIVFIALLFPIQDKNIAQSGMDMVVKWSASAFTSDGGFHVFMGLMSLCAGISEILICRTAEKSGTGQS